MCANETAQSASSSACLISRSSSNGLACLLYSTPPPSRARALSLFLALTRLVFILFSTKLLFFSSYHRVYCSNDAGDLEVRSLSAGSSLSSFIQVPALDTHLFIHFYLLFVSVG